MTAKEYESFVVQNHKRIFNYILKMVRSHEDAQDVLQETFVTFYKKRNSIKEVAFLAYLYKIAYSKSLDHIKKKKKINEKSVTFDDSYHKVPENNDEPIDNANEIKQAIGLLPEKMATIVDLKYFHKKSYHEIAKILSITTSAVDSLLVRAKKKLRKTLQDSETKEVY